MATKVVMEALSPTMEEGRLVEWKKAEGDKVAAGDVLAEVETDKAVMELVARADGVLLKQVVAEGATVPVAEVVGWIGQPGEEVPGGGGAAPAAPAAAPKAEAAPAAAAAAAAPATPAAPEPAAAATPAPGGDARVKASPVARRMAAEKGIDLASISGSGPEGRIIKRDVESAQPGQRAASAAPAAIGTAFTDVPLSQMRKVIARRLAQSIGPIPTFYLTAEVDMERAAEARDALVAANP